MGRGPFRMLRFPRSSLLKGLMCQKIATIPMETAYLAPQPQHFPFFVSVFPYSSIVGVE